MKTRDQKDLPKPNHSTSYVAISETEMASIRMILTILDIEKIVKRKWRNGEVSFEDAESAEFYLIQSLTSFSELHKLLLKKLSIHLALRHLHGERSRANMMPQNSHLHLQK